MNSNKAMMARRSDAVPRGVGQIHPIFAERAENCRVWDVEGREYLDFARRYRGAQYLPPASAGCRRRRRPAEKAVAYLLPGAGL